MPRLILGNEGAHVAQRHAQCSASLAISGFPRLSHGQGSIKRESNLRRLDVVVLRRVDR